MMVGPVGLDLHESCWSRSVVIRKWRPNTFASLPSHADIVQFHFWLFVLDLEALTLIEKRIPYLMTLHQ